MPMTPVQLPEVPAPAAWAMTDYQPEANTQFTMRADAAEHYASVGLHVEPLYHAAQLREYATAAVRQYANAIFAEGWYLACDWASRDDLKFDVDSPAFEADRAARIGNLLTSLESEK